MAQPDNQNFLSPVGFKFNINKLPNVEWFIQSVNLPGITVGSIKMAKPFRGTDLPGDNFEYEPLNIRFKVDEDLSNCSEIQNWMIGLGFPDSYDQYADLLAERTTSASDPRFSDATLTCLNSNMNGNFAVTFEDVFPVSLSSLEFDSMASDIDYLTADVTFQYLTYTFTKLP